MLLLHQPTHHHLAIYRNTCFSLHSTSTYTLHSLQSHLLDNQQQCHILVPSSKISYQLNTLHLHLRRVTCTKCNLLHRILEYKQRTLQTQSEMYYLTFFVVSPSLIFMYSVQTPVIEFGSPKKHVDWRPHSF